MPVGVILPGILIILIVIFIGLCIWSFLVEYRYDKAIANLIKTSNAPIAFGDVYVQVDHKEYKVSQLRRESYPRVNNQTGIASWSEPRLDWAFEDAATKISNNGVQITANVHITPCQIQRIYLKDVRIE